MYYKSNSNNQWLIPPGRYSASFKQAVSDDPKVIRMLFALPKQRGINGEKIAAKYYTAKGGYYLQKDLENWLGRDNVRKLFPDRELGVSSLRKLIGQEAVVVITNEDHGKPDPLVKIEGILPNTRENLEGTTTIHDDGPKFRLSFDEDADDGAMAA
jgi:hypothetical protein